MCLNTVLNSYPVITFSLASIGLASIFWILYSFLKPLLSYFTESGHHLLIFWTVSLIIAGGAVLGYGQNSVKGACEGGGIASLVSGAVVLAIYWLHKWVKWVNPG